MSKTEPSETIQVYVASQYVQILLEHLNFTSLLNLRFVWASEAPLPEHPKQQLTYLKIRVFYPQTQTGNSDLACLSMSHLMLVLEMAVPSLPFLGFMLFEKIELIREAFLEPIKSSDSKIVCYCLNLGFDSSITDSELNNLAIFFKTRMLGYGALEELALVIQDVSEVLSVSFNGKQGLVENAKVDGFAQFVQLLTEHFDPKGLSRANDTPIVLQNDSAIIKGNLNLVTATFSFSKPNFIAFMLIRMYFIISRTVIGNSYRTYLKMMYLRPLGRNQYRFCVGFHHPSNTFGIEFTCRLKLVVELFLKAFGIEGAEFRFGAAVCQPTGEYSVTQSKYQLQMNSRDYKFLHDIVRPIEPKKTDRTTCSSQLKKQNQPKEKRPSYKELLAMEQKAAKLRKREEANLERIKAAQKIAEAKKAEILSSTPSTETLQASASALMEIIETIVEPKTEAVRAFDGDITSEIAPSRPIIGDQIAGPNLDSLETFADNSASVENILKVEDVESSETVANVMEPIDKFVISALSGEASPSVVICISSNLSRVNHRRRLPSNRLDSFYK